MGFIPTEVPPSSFLWVLFPPRFLPHRGSSLILPLGRRVHPSLFLPFIRGSSLNLFIWVLFALLKSTLLITSPQIAIAPTGTQACTLDIAKFHRTCPVIPDHKPWLVVQGHAGDFFIDHDHPFGLSCASSNSGMIANAAVDIWMAEGIRPILKYEDDLNIFRRPIDDGPFLDGEHRYAYDREHALRIIHSLQIPWHPDKGTLHFSSIFTFIGMLWNIDLHRVSLPENKRMKFLHRTRAFLDAFSRRQCQLRDIESIHGSLCYISFVYVEGRSRLPSLSNFAVTFNGNEFIHRYPPPSVISDLKWWSSQLEMTNFYRQLTPRGPSLDFGIFVDASTSWGIGIIFDGKWMAWKLSSTWKIPGRDICWLETLAVEFLCRILEMYDFKNCSIIIHSDNQGTIGSMHKGRSPNVHVNHSIRRIHAILIPRFITPVLTYVASENNLADPLSRGEQDPSRPKLPSFELPCELRNIFVDAS